MTDIETIRLRLTGMPGSPLVVHNFSEKSKESIRTKQQKRAKSAKAARAPGEECEAAKYRDNMNRECAPITAIKRCFVDAGTAMDNLTKVALRQALFVAPTLAPASMFVPIQTLDGQDAVGVMREDAVTIGVNTRDLAYRPGYPEWTLRVTVEFNTRLISRDQLLALARHAGWGVGICEGRPQKTSALGWGRFERV